MNQPPLHKIDVNETSIKNRFPILLQLSLLGLILLLIFGGLFFTRDEQTSIVTTTEATSQNNFEHPNVPQKIDDIELRATSAFVWDVKDQRVLYEKNSDKTLPLASLTKLMTTLLAHELIEESHLTRIPISAILQEGDSGLSEGEEMKIQALRKLALISSSNDAAYALAASVGELLGNNDPINQFVQGMNIRADELGLHTLQFWNTTGLDINGTKPGAIGNARDVSFLMEYILKNYPEIIEPTQESSTRVYNTDGAYHEVDNTNDIAVNIPNLIGSKTGFTDLAGGNLVVAFDIGMNHPVVITVLGSTRTERFSDVLTLVAAVQETMRKY